MYRAYKITSDIVENQLSLLPLTKLSQFAFELEIEDQKKELITKLEELIKGASLGKDTIDASSIWNDWFPEIKADVFISHSSKDVEVAKKLSQWLKEKFNLTSFIDSQIWGHSDKLLKELDNKYCWKAKSETYSYEKRNGSTAHVHMILSYALTRMIDKTECFIFVESANSVSAEDSIEGTLSPWIFHELATVDTIESRKPDRLKNRSVELLEKLTKASLGLKVKYPILGKRLIQINRDTLVNWEISGGTSLDSLDWLYEITIQAQVR